MIFETMHPVMMIMIVEYLKYKRSENYCNHRDVEDVSTDIWQLKDILFIPFEITRSEIAQMAQMFAIIGAHL